MNRVMNLRVYKIRTISLPNKKTTSVYRRTLPRGVNLVLMKNEYDVLENESQEPVPVSWFDVLLRQCVLKHVN
jgi:hypothetical protein